MEVVIVEAVRTAVGRLGGALKDIEANHLASLINEYSSVLHTES